MKKQTFWGVVATTIALTTAAVQAATVTIEPDDYSGLIAGGPGVQFYTLRENATHDWFAVESVYSAAGGSWNPTGRRVFGHSVLSPGEAAHHWDSLNGAWMCYVMQVCTSFTVLAASFTEPVSTVRLLTTMRGQMAPDPVELWAFNTLGQRIQRCRVKGIDIAILASGVLPPPTLYMSNIPCGKVLQKKNCSGQPGNCDFVVEMEVRRHQAIGMVWFAGPLYQNSYANADALSYEVF